jgi:hypothetical protein
VFTITEIVLPATEPLPWNHLSVVLGVLSIYLGLAYLTRYTQGFYVYEWMSPAYRTISIVLHVLGYAGGIIALFVMTRYAILARNTLTDRLRRRKEGGLGEKGFQLDDRSDIWSARVRVVRPTPMCVQKSFEVVVAEV